MISISLVLLMVSCQQEAESPNVYEVRFTNQYFEPLATVEIAGNTIENVDVGQEIIIGNIPRGEHTITVTTASGLLIQADVSLTGSSPSVQITLAEDGILRMG